MRHKLCHQKRLIAVHEAAAESIRYDQESPSANSNQPAGCMRIGQKRMLHIHECVLDNSSASLPPQELHNIAVTAGLQYADFVLKFSALFVCRIEGECLHAPISGHLGLPPNLIRRWWLKLCPGIDTSSSLSLHLYAL